MWEVLFSQIYSSFYLIFCNDNETALLRYTCWRTAVPWDANVISLEILMRARGWRTGIGFGVGMTRREERRMSRLSQASLFGFSPSRDLSTLSQCVPGSSLSSWTTVFISSLSGYFILLPRGRFPRIHGILTRVDPLSLREIISSLY